MRTAYVFLSILVTASVAVAGPPMICHPVEVGDAECLPWGSKPFEKSRGFQTSKLVEATVKLLDGSSSPLAHMETLRRATLYCDNDTRLATRLFATLAARALSAELEGGSDAGLALLDAGYLAQCYDQLNVRTDLRFGSANGIVGYAWVQRSLELNPDDAEFEFAAAMMTARGGGSVHDRHVVRARKLAARDSLVSKNLKIHAKKYWHHPRNASARSRRSPG